MFFSKKYGSLNFGSTASYTSHQDESSSQNQNTSSQNLDRRIDATIRSIQDGQHTRQQITSHLGHTKGTEEYLEIHKAGSVPQSEEASDVLKQFDRERSRRSVGVVDRDTNTTMATVNANRRSTGRRRSIGTTTATEAPMTALGNGANFNGENTANFDNENTAKAAPPSRSRRAAGHRNTDGYQKQMSKSPVRRNHDSTHQVPRDRSQSRSNHSREFAMSPSTPSGGSSSRKRRSLPIESVNDSNGPPTAPELGREGKSDSTNDDPKVDITGVDNTMDGGLDRSSDSEEMQISWERVPSVRRNLNGPPTGKWGRSVRHIKKQDNSKLPKASVGVEDTKDNALDRSNRAEEMQISWQRIPSVRKNLGVPPAVKWGGRVRHTNTNDDLKQAAVGLEDTKDDVLTRSNPTAEMQISWQRVPSARKLVDAPKAPAPLIWRNRRPVNAPVPMHNEKRSPGPSYRQDRNSTTDSPPETKKGESDDNGLQRSAHNRTVILPPGGMGTSSPYNSRNRAMQAIQNTEVDEEKVPVLVEQDGNKGDALDHSTRSWRTAGMDHSTRNRRTTERNQSKRSRRTARMDRTTPGTRPVGINYSTHSTGMQITWRREPIVRKNAGNVPMHWYTRSGNKSSKPLVKRVPRDPSINNAATRRRERRLRRAKSAEKEALPTAPLAATDTEYVNKNGIGEIAKLLERSKQLDKANESQRGRTKQSTRKPRARTRRRTKSPVPDSKRHTIPTHWQRNSPKI